MIDQARPIGSGDIIIAPPMMKDSRFEQSVIMLTHRKAGTSFGLCLNKRSEFTVDDLADEIEVDIPYDIPLYWGGPVSTQTIWMLHTNEWYTDSTFEISDQWSMTSSLDMFHALADGDVPIYYRLFYGFCGWSRGQLEGELEGAHPWTKASSWLTWRDPQSELILDVEPDELWRIATEQSSHQAVSEWL